MKTPRSHQDRTLPPAPGTYRLARGVRLVNQRRVGARLIAPTESNQAFAISDYPLKIVRLSATAARALRCCREQRTCAELAGEMQLSLKRASALCEQLRWKGLLEAGPLLPPERWPHVSILIPAYNRAAELKRCLHSLEALDYPADCLEIVVIDDASTDETEAMLRAYIRQAEAVGRQVRTVRNAQRRGVAISRNIGAEAARYDVLAYIDSDCVASPCWLNDLVPAFQDTGIAAVGGMMRALDRTALLGRYEDVRSSLFMGAREQQVRLEGPVSYLPSANLLMRRAAWREIGGFAPLTWGEDVDFCRRLLAANQRILYLPQGVVYHDYRTAWRPFLRTRAAYASSEAALLKRHPEQRRVLLLPPEQAIFAGMTMSGMWLIAFILALFGAFRRWRKVQAQGIPIRPLAIVRATLRGHLAYTYHLCRHMTRYYTLPLLLIGLMLPPLLLLAIMLCGIVIGVDYARLRPEMGFGAYALCSVLDDCAYEVGVVVGCMKHGTWKPLWPVLKRHP
jgi:mycofactocin system glycosyltransferase